VSDKKKKQQRFKVQKTNQLSKAVWNNKNNASKRVSFFLKGRKDIYPLANQWPLNCNGLQRITVPMNVRSHSNKGTWKNKKKLAYQDQQNQQKTKKGMKNFIQSPANQWLLSCNGSQRNQRMKQCQKPLKQEGTRKP
jgi:hypothetical protein